MVLKFHSPKKVFETAVEEVHNLFSLTYKSRVFPTFFLKLVLDEIYHTDIPIHSVMLLSSSVHSDT